MIREDLGLKEDEQIVYDYLCCVEKAQISEIIKASNYGRSKATAILNRLIDKSLVMREGNGRVTKYRKK